MKNMQESFQDSINSLELTKDKMQNMVPSEVHVALKNRYQQVRSGRISLSSLLATLASWSSSLKMFCTCTGASRTVSSAREGKQEKSQAPQNGRHLQRSPSRLLLPRLKCKPTV